MTIVDRHTTEPQLLRLPYQSQVTGEWREFLVYLPVGDRSQPSYRWPVIFFLHGGRDTLNKPQWAYDMANALERAGHRSVRFTVHEDCGHGC